MAFLFDTNAISEPLRPRPNEVYLAWLRQLPRGEQFTSAIVVGELYAGAWMSGAPQKWLRRYEDQILPRLTILPFDLPCAQVYGQLRAELARIGTPIGDADTQIAATALRHDLTLVTANRRHFERIPQLKLRLFAPENPQQESTAP